MRLKNKNFMGFQASKSESRSSPPVTFFRGRSILRAISESSSDEDEGFLKSCNPSDTIADTKPPFSTKPNNNNNIHSTTSYSSDVEQQVQVVLALLGTELSGKSTLLKNMYRLLHREGDTLNTYNKQHYSAQCYNSILQCLVTLYKYRTILFPDETFQNEQYLKQLSSFEDTSIVLENQLVDPKLPLLLEYVWRSEPLLHKLYWNRHQIPEMNGMDTFVDLVEKMTIQENSSSVSFEQYIKIYMKTSGVIDSVLSIKDKDVLVKDVGGAVSERKKWKHVFDTNLTSIFFCVSLSEYCECYENTESSKMKDSMSMFSMIANMPDIPPIYLIFTKSDVFKRRIKYIDLSCCFQDVPFEWKFSAEQEAEIRNQMESSLQEEMNQVEWRTKLENIEILLQMSRDALEDKLRIISENVSVKKHSKKKPHTSLDTQSTLQDGATLDSLQKTISSRDVEEDVNTSRLKFMQLPEEFLLHIISFLDSRSLMGLQRTCSKLYLLGNSDAIWKPLCNSIVNSTWIMKENETKMEDFYRQRYLEPYSEKYQTAVESTSSIRQSKMNPWKFIYTCGGSIRYFENLKFIQAKYLSLIEDPNRREFIKEHMTVMNLTNRNSVRHALKHFIVPFALLPYTPAGWESSTKPISQGDKLIPLDGEEEGSIIGATEDS